MSAEASIDIYQKPESYFESYEEEYRLLTHMALIELAKRVVESPVIKPAKRNQKTVPAFTYRMCAMLVRSPSKVVQYAERSLGNYTKNKELHQTMQQLGILVRGGSNELQINDEFVAAMELYEQNTPEAAEIWKEADLIRHGQNMQNFCDYYFNQIELQASRGIGIDSTIIESLRHIQFYVGYSDPHKD